MRSSRRRRRLLESDDREWASGAKFGATNCVTVCAVFVCEGRGVGFPNEALELRCSAIYWELAHRRHHPLPPHLPKEAPGKSERRGGIIMGEEGARDFTDPDHRFLLHPELRTLESFAPTASPEDSYPHYGQWHRFEGQPLFKSPRRSTTKSGGAHRLPEGVTPAPLAE